MIVFDINVINIKYKKNINNHHIYQKQRYILKLPQTVALLD